MITLIKAKLQEFTTKENQLTQKILKNIGLSFIIKVLNIAVGLLLVPMTISYVNPIQYGIWLTISSIVGWMSFFDIGLGNGLRNKLAQLLALNRLNEAQKYVSTTFALISIISGILFILFCLVNPLLNWGVILNTPPTFTGNIHIVTTIVLSSFCIQFILQITNIILTALHQSAKAALITFSGQLGVLIVLFILKVTVPGNLFLLVTTLTGVPIIVIIAFNIYLYKTKLKDLAPSFKFTNFGYTKEILLTGSSFFVIQIGAMVLFQTDNIIIAQVIGPSSVTEFNIAYKLFTVITMFFTIIITPYWSAFTDAYTRNDFTWMKNSLNFMRKVCLLFSVGAIILCILSKLIYKIWIGQQVTVDVTLSVSITVYVIVFMWQTIHVYILNGMTKIKLQLILVVISSIVNIPLAIILGKIWGAAGVITANTVVFIIMGVIFSIQVNKILNQTSQGIWNK